MSTTPDAASLAAAPAKSKPYKITIGQGLALLVNPSGSKQWRFRYRFGGVAKSLSMGPFPAVPLEQAIQARDEARAMLKAGTDPSAARKAGREANMPQRQRANTFRLVLSQENALTIETPRQVLRLTPEQTAAVRAFLLAADPESNGHAPD
ncbi:Arm DNA-binding domain-containing protein [Azorhizophilus paspali]|uniref:Arm DNA-binding domain-containing protein n=1 Tax=Azorhizophilus paspali TaxID=69963 RepID=A0ABV6SJP8_AZOPA